VEALWQYLSPLLPGVCIEVLASSESTNTVLLDRVRHAVRAASDGQGERPALVGVDANSGRATFGRRAHDLQPCLLVAEH
ncbi:biotin--[acetyl-CoA-carboxylase] ligase, partial [Roseateles sp. GG27B]